MESYITFLIDLGRTDLKSVHIIIYSYLNQLQQVVPTDVKHHLSEFLNVTQKICKKFPYKKRNGNHKTRQYLHGHLQYTKQILLKTGSRGTEELHLINELMNIYTTKPTKPLRIASYEKQIDELKKEIKDYEVKVTEYKDTISKMMMAQEIGRVDGNESLMDKYRPSYIKEKFRSLYVNSYGELDADIEELQLLDDEKGRCQVLLDILFDAFKLSGDYSQEGKRNANFNLTSLFSSDPFNKEKKVITKYMQESICNNLKENPDPHILQDIKKKVRENINSHLKAALNIEQFRKSLESYVSQCVDVTWLMQCSNPPLFISTEMRKFHKNLHQRDSGRGQYVEYYLWPTLFTSKEQFQRNEASFDKGAVHLTDKIESLNIDQTFIILSPHQGKNQNL